MVTSLFPLSSVALLGYATDQAQPLLQRLDPQKRASLLMALAGLIILALGWMVMVYLGARFVKRIARQRPPQRPRELSDWKRKAEVDDPGNADERR